MHPASKSKTRSTFEMELRKVCPQCRFDRGMNGKYTDRQTELFWQVWELGIFNAIECAQKLILKLGRNEFSMEQDKVEQTPEYFANALDELMPKKLLRERRAFVRF